MANWRTKIRLTDLHELNKAKKIEPTELGKEVAKRLKATKYAKDEVFEQIINLFENEVFDIEDYDNALCELYDFADEGHRIWIETMR